MRIFAILLAGLLCNAPVQAEIITYNYTGIFNTLRVEINGATRNVVSTQAFPGGIKIGDAFHGTFSYDTDVNLLTTITHLYSSGYDGSFDPTSQPSHSSFTLNNTDSTFSSATALTSVSLGRWSRYANIGNFIGPLQTSFIFEDSSMRASTVIPTNLDLDMESAYLFLRYEPVNQESLSAWGILTNLEKVSPVPETEIYGMFLAGLGMIGFLAHKRRTKID